MSTTSAPQSTETRTVTVIRRCLLVLFVLGVAGTGAELLLVGHTEGFWQWIPLLLILISLAVLNWHALAPRPSTIRAFQGTMLLFILSGLVGLFLHYDGKVEFKLESNPSLAGWELFKDAMTGAMPPALAPAAMIQFGLLGLVYAYRHPSLAASKKNESTNTKSKDENAPVTVV